MKKGFQSAFEDAKMNSELKIEVFVSLRGENIFAGNLAFQKLRKKNICGFSYNTEWLQRPDSFAFDPQLPLVSGIQFAPQGMDMHGCFADACPDRWGRALMRRSRLKQGLPPPGEADCLLGTSDACRIGCFRFRRQGESDWQAALACGVPAMKSLPEFAMKIASYERDGADADFLDLLEPGSSLGGARPKLAVSNVNDHSLWIAKFPSIKDEADICLLEKINFDTALRCGIQVPETKLFKLPNGSHVLLSKRFDRAADACDREVRIPYASAMTLLSSRDGDPEQHAYPELALVLQESGASPQAECREIWKRELFNVLAGNRDDHLRNHAFLRKTKGWTPAPAFDLECAKGKKAHALALSSDGCTEPSMEAVFEAADWFGVGRKEALETAAAFGRIIASWRSDAARYGLSADDKDALAESRGYGERWTAASAGTRVFPARN